MTHLIVISNTFSTNEVKTFKEKHQKIKVLLMEEVENMGKSNFY